MLDTCSKTWLTKHIYGQTTLKNLILCLNFKKIYFGDTLTPQALKNTLPFSTPKFLLDWNIF